MPDELTVFRLLCEHRVQIADDLLAQVTAQPRIQVFARPPLCIQKTALSVLLSQGAVCSYEHAARGCGHVTGRGSSYEAAHRKRTCVKTTNLLGSSLSTSVSIFSNPGVRRTFSSTWAMTSLTRNSFTALVRFRRASQARNDEHVSAAIRLPLKQPFRMQACKELRS